MKKATTQLLFVLLLSFTSLNAQTVGKLYGLTALGGDSSGGVLFNYNTLTSLDSLTYQFSAYSPIYPNYTFSSLILGTDGNFYGMSAEGGSADLGVVYKCTPAGRMTVIANFTGPNGQQPRGSLVQAIDGNLYGMTDVGGKYGEGVIFKCTTTGGLDTLISFNGVNGAEPTTGSLIQAADGNLYGMTEGGGKYNDGVIFKCSTSGMYDTLISFNGRNGGNPWGSLVQGSDSKLYGMSTVGGKYGDGVIFSCTTSGVLDTLASFDYTNGQTPYGNLIEATDGNFYGMAYGGGQHDEGTLFKYDTTAKVIDTLVSFNTGNGAYPVASLIQASDGNFYGTTLDGGAKGEGVVFKYNTTAKTYDTLVSFNDGVTGEYPISSFIQSNGNLYGLTWQGGIAANGTLFQCTTGGTLSVIYNIGTTALGYYPFSSLIQASDGYLYGTSTASYKTNNGNGTIFRCLPSGANMTTLVVFTGANGLSPDGKVIQASDGNLYGMTHGGGKYGYGVIYKYTIPGGAFDTLVSFNNTDGAFPWGNLIQSYDGNFYGVTSGGGSSNDGTVFKCTTSGLITVFHSFAGGGDGQTPHGSLIQGKDSVLYGMTELGGSESAGTIFKCTTSGTYNSIAGLGGSSLQVYPFGSFVQGVDGNLYGLSSQGGNSSEGSLFECTMSGKITNLVTFTGAANGSIPQGTLIQASDSSLYGMTTSGGKYGFGVLFKYTISSGIYDTLLSFNGANGESPQYGNLLELMNVSIDSISTCAGYKLTAVVSGGGAGVPAYLWSTTATTSNITIDTAGTYTVTVKNQGGLSLTASITVPTYTLPSLPTFTQQGDTLISSSQHNNQWYRNDTLLVNDTSQDLIIATTGWYWVSVNSKANNCIIASDSIDITSLTGISQLTIESGQLTVYPNPSGGLFTITSEKDIDKIKVTNMLGQLIYEAQPKQTQFTFELNDAGMYFVTVMTGDKVSTSKVIVSK